MPKPSETPKHLHPYKFHGVVLDRRDGDDNAHGDCPFCGKEGKFGVDVKEGLWKCFVCGMGGNVYTFLRELWKMSDAKTNGETKVLAKDRGLLFPETLTHWGACVSVLTGEWLVPGYGADGKLNQLYKYARDHKSKRMTLYATPGLNHCLFGVGMYDKSKSDVYLTEGPWDGMALWESLKSAKSVDGNGTLAFTGNQEVSLLSNANVLSVPGCTTFREEWRPLFAGKRVHLMYDNDHPRQHEGRTIEPAGYAGMRRVAKILAESGEEPEEVRYLKWGEPDHDSSLKSGYDIRDALSAPDISSRVKQVETLLPLLEPIPTDWIAGRKKSSAPGKVEMDLLPCSSWKVMVQAWRKAMRWTDGLDRALAVMLASATSTKAVGDQLWVKIVGPPSCGKSVLAEAMSVAKKYVKALSTLRGFHSGFNDGSGEDSSPIVGMMDKTVIVKDGDTLLKAPNLEQILSEARDIYDRVSRSSFRNKISQEYSNINLTLILCGTSSIRKLDSSELGERFVDCVIMDRIDDDLEDEVLLRKVHQVDRTVGIEASSGGTSNDDPDMVKVKQLTGGYVTYLRENAMDLVRAVATTDEMKLRCARLGKFVSYTRARPSKIQDETADRECGYRLASQFMRLAKFLAVVLNKTEVDEEVMARVRSVAFDTARGVTLDLVVRLHGEGRVGMTSAVLSSLTGQTPNKTRELLRFLKRLGAVELYDYKETVRHTRGEVRYRLTHRMTTLYGEVVV